MQAGERDQEGEEDQMKDPEEVQCQEAAVVVAAHQQLEELEAHY